MHNKIILFLFIYFLPFFIHAQQYKTNWYTTDNGLPQNSVKDIVKDASGFLWLSTENGIVRYDGINFQTYNFFQVFNYNFSTFFGTTKRENIYIENANEENLICIKNRTISKIKKKKEVLETEKTIIFKRYIHNILNPEYKSIFFYSIPKNIGYVVENDSLKHIDNQTKKETKLPVKIIDKEIHDCFVIDERFFMLDKKKHTIYDFFKGKLSVTKADAVFLNKDSKLYWSQINNQIFVLLDNNLYLGFYKNGSLQTKKLMNIKNFENYGIFSLYFDNYYNKLYMGTITNGLCVVSFQSFKVVKKSNRVDDAVVYAHLPFEDNNSIIDPKGTVYNSNGVIKEFPFFDRIDKYGMINDNEGNIWTKSNNNIYRYEKKKNYKLTQELFFKDKISNIYNLKNFNAISFYNPSYNGILLLYDKKGFEKVVKKILFKNQISFVKQITEDILLVACKNGLYQVTLSKNTIEKVIDENEFNIRNIVQSKSGNIWILTSGKGYYLFREKNLIKMPLDDKKSLETVHTILEQKNGMFWISTNNGLFKIQESELLKYANNLKTNLHYYKYRKNDGLKTNEFNGGCSPAGTILKNGEFVLPSLNGFVFFNPDEIKNQYPQNGVFVERAKIDNHKMEYFEETLYIENDFYKANIYIDTPYYSNYENLFCEVFLKGKSKNWERVAANGVFSISNLEHGTYTLIARVLVNEKGIYSYKTIKIVVAPLFYQTFAFRLSAFLFGFVLIFLIHKLRTNYLVKKNIVLEKKIEERTIELKNSIAQLENLKEFLKKESVQQKKLIGSITHDIITPIKYFSISLKKLFNAEDENNLTKKNQLESIYKSSLEIYNFSKTLKDYAVLYNNEAHITNQLYILFDLVQEKINLFSEISKNKNIKLQNDIGINIKTVISKNILAVILHNLIDNAVKYTNEGEITITALEKEQEIHIQLKDNGIGMSDQKIAYYSNLQLNENNEKLLIQKDGIGLNLVAQLLLIINGKISFLRNTEGGTTVTLIIKKP